LNVLYSGQYEEESEPEQECIRKVKEEHFSFEEVEEKEERPLKKSKMVSYDEIESLFAKKFEEQAKLAKIEKEILEEKMELQRLESEARFESLISLITERLKKEEPVAPTPSAPLQKEEKTRKSTRKTSKVATKKEEITPALPLSETTDFSSLVSFEEEEAEVEEKQPKKRSKSRKGAKKVKKAVAPKKTRQAKLEFKTEDHVPTEVETEPEDPIADNALALVVQPEIDLKQREEEQRIQFAKEQDVMIHDSLAVYTGYIGSTKQTNIGVSFAGWYKLNSLLDKLDSEIDVYKQRSDREEEERAGDSVNPFITDEKYKLFLLSNLTVFVPHGWDIMPVIELEEAQRKKLTINTELPVNRINTANILLHTWFTRKALKHNAQKDPSHLITMIENRPFVYDPEIVRRWFPCFSAGNGTILLENLECHAVGVKKGQGFGKRCLFCEMQFVGIKCGTIKYSHHPDLCDTLANLSNDERIVLETVVQKCKTSPEFADHDFIKQRSETSLMRLATEEEIEAGLFVEYAAKNEKVRLNMPVYMKMRSKTYDFFMTRIRTLDRASDEEKNLGAKSMPGLLDCFNLNSRVGVKKNKNNNPKKSIDAEDGFLFRTLVDSDGNSFMQTKTTKVKSKRVSLRSFEIDEKTGFGSEMYFSLPMPFPFDPNMPMMMPFNPNMQMMMPFNPNVQGPPFDPSLAMPFVFNPHQEIDPAFQPQLEQQQQQSSDDDDDMSSNIDFTDEPSRVTIKTEEMNIEYNNNYYQNESNIVYETPVVEQQHDENEIKFSNTQEAENPLFVIDQYSSALHREWNNAPDTFKIEEEEVDFYNHQRNSFF
jgi:hypothetical protein